MEHKCFQEKDIQQLKVDIAVAQSDIRQVKTDISEMKADIKKAFWIALTTLLGVSIQVAMEFVKVR